MFADLTPALWLHVTAAMAALLCGALLLAGRKGTARHRFLGYAYLTSMMLVLLGAGLAPATFIPLFGTRFGFFHIFMVLGAISMLTGLAALRRWRKHRDAKALQAHQIHLSYSYAGLLMAGVSQLAANPGWGLSSIGSPAAFWMTFGLANAGMYAIAVWLIHGRVARRSPQTASE